MDEYDSEEGEDELMEEGEDEMSDDSEARENLKEMIKEGLFDSKKAQVSGFGSSSGDDDYNDLVEDSDGLSGEDIEYDSEDSDSDDEDEDSEDSFE